VQDAIVNLTRTTVGEVLARYERRWHLYAQATPRLRESGLNHSHIRRKWLNVHYAERCPLAVTDIYLPNDGDGPFPVILFAYGGGYCTRRADLAALSKWQCSITPATPPFVIMHGRQDVIVPYQQGVRLARRQEQAIGPEKVRFTLYDDYVHADRRLKTTQTARSCWTSWRRCWGVGKL